MSGNRRALRLMSVGTATVLTFGLTGALHASTLMPAAILDSGLTIQIEAVGSVGPPSASNDFEAPVAIGDDLYVVDHTGAILLQNGAGFDEVLDTAGLPDGVTPASRTPIVNMAGSGNRFAGRSALWRRRL